MDMQMKERFLEKWKKYFNGAIFPLLSIIVMRQEMPRWSNLLQDISASLACCPRFERERPSVLMLNSIGCGGGKRYLGFTQEIMPDFEYFLSCGIPGKLEGERYKKTPELVKEAMKRMPEFKAPARFIVFKRWDKLEKQDNPEVVIFFAQPDVLSGLFTLTNFDEADPNGVFAPFSAGCGSIVQYPYLEKDSTRPRGVLGMFDVSARPFVPKETLTFALPMNKFLEDD